MNWKAVSLIQFRAAALTISEVARRLARHAEWSTPLLERPPRQAAFVVEMHSDRDGSERQR